MIEKDWLEKDEKYLSNALYRIFHLVIEKGEGPYLFTTDQEKYLDLTSGIGVTQLGHCHPEIVKASQEQLEKLFHISCVAHHTQNIKLAEKLAAILPGGIDNTFFCNSGAEAVEGAIKISRYQRPGRPNLIAFRPAFHGRTLGATALSSSKITLRQNYDPLLAGVNFVDFPNCWSCPVFKKSETCELECLDLLKRMFKLHLPPESVSAIIIEAIIGEGGYIPAPKGRFNYLKELRSICDQHGILLIIDEVQSGIGRTGKWFASDHYEIEPDIITMAKGLANGLPIGAFSAKHELMSKMPPGSHGNTFGGNPVSCTAAYKTLEIIERDNILNYVAEAGEEIIKHLSIELKDYAKVRGFGFMLGLELESKEKVDQVIQKCFAEKILILSAGTNALRIIPPLNTEKPLLLKTIDKLIGIIKSCS